MLYVALTRAKEKLILTGSHKNLQRCLEGLHSLLGRKEKRLPYGMLEGAQEYWGWVLPALARHPALTKWYRDREMGGSDGEFYFSQEIPLTFQTVRAADLVGKEMKRQILGETRYQEYSQWEGKEKYDPQLAKELEERFSYVYPYAYLQEIPGKISVSDLKRPGNVSRGTDAPADSRIYAAGERRIEGSGERNGLSPGTGKAGLFQSRFSERGGATDCSDEGCGKN